MTKKKENWNELHAQRREIALRRHIEDLGLDGTDDYLKWCAEHGFRACRAKKLECIRQELRYHQKKRTRDQLKDSRSLKSMLGIIARLFDGDLQFDAIHSDEIRAVCQRIYDVFTTRHERNMLFEYLAFVEQKTSMLEQRELIANSDVYYVHALLSLFSHRKRWLRPYREWQISSHNCRKQFNSLWRHLLASYSTPDFFDNVWFLTGRKGRKDQVWIISISQGASPRSELAPFSLTARMAHEFLQAPATCSVLHAVRWGQIMAMGGTEPLFQAFIHSRVGRTRVNSDFWVTVMQFFITHKNLAIRHVGPMVDYLQRQKYTVENIQRFCGTWQSTPPAQPDFSLKGRTPKALLRNVRRWHSALGTSGADSKLVWSSGPIGNYSVLLGKCKTQKRWRFQELTSHAALLREGQAMGHCVGIYAKRCFMGAISIWSLTAETCDGLIERKQTIEVSRDGRVIQCRGKFNQLPDKEELRAVSKWASEKHLLMDLGI